VICGLLASAAASAAIVPAASAAILGRPDPGGPGGTRLIPVPATIVREIHVGGMAGWQIGLIAVGTALMAAVVAVLLDRTLSNRRAAYATIA
jgi:hypothetical protein